MFADTDTNPDYVDSLPLLDLNCSSRQHVLAYFENTWRLTDVLFSALKAKTSYYQTPYHQLRHPLIFYYGHSAVLYVNKCKLAGLIEHGINPYFEELFATGVDEMSWDDMSKNHKPWPKLQDVIAYRTSAYQLICTIIETHPGFEQPITQDSPLWAIVMSFEHERIHLETTSVLMRELALQYLTKPNEWPAYFPLNTDRDYPENKMIAVAAKKIRLGKPTHWPSFGWDNEYGEKDVSVSAFRASQFLISNGEHLEFVKQNGYDTQRYWSEEGWRWRNFRKINHPTFWIPKQQHDYQLRLCFEVIPMQWNWPVNVNFHEAYAYCIWRSEFEQQSVPFRIMTEAEHHCMREPDHNDQIMENNSARMREIQININLAYGSESAVDAGIPTKAGFYDVFGNVWQHCSNYFAPLLGFKTHRLYEDFSTPCFDDDHNMLMGGSFISTGDEASKWARYHFRRHFFQHAGFRIVQSIY